MWQEIMKGLPKKVTGVRDCRQAANSPSRAAALGVQEKSLQSNLFLNPYPHLFCIPLPIRFLSLSLLTTPSLPYTYTSRCELGIVTVQLLSMYILHNIQHFRCHVSLTISWGLPLRSHCFVECLCFKNSKTSVLLTQHVNIQVILLLC